eukprot:TRINITY_DN65415_c0_g1_i1.p1 TRINITY_DN65415_c0_g1~~TRINITY_DN65415_c0_g1_i1.p1  ORF type:complete len:170 (+),score=10.25 TRINITY_DN65415_c0_g1_i1:238-747(+)
MLTAGPPAFDFSQPEFTSRHWPRKWHTYFWETNSAYAKRRMLQLITLVPSLLPKPEEVEPEGPESAREHASKLVATAVGLQHRRQTSIKAKTSPAHAQEPTTASTADGSFVQEVPALTEQSTPTASTARAQEGHPKDVRDMLSDAQSGGPSWRQLASESRKTSSDIICL